MPVPLLKSVLAVSTKAGVAKVAGAPDIAGAVVVLLNWSAEVTR